MSAQTSITLDKKSIAAFVMPVFLDGGTQAIGWLNQAVDSVLAQTDPYWRLIMINDQSPHPGTVAELHRLQAKDNRIDVITNPTNMGAGFSRNVGIQWAHKQDYPLILYLDSDDIAHSRRLEVARNIMSNDTTVGVVYSGITIIDENNAQVPQENLSGAILEILECNRNNPPQGDKAWIDIGTLTGYANLTSSTAVTTALAIKQPFPNVRAVEDSHAWVRYGAEGKHFVYDPTIPAQYRIPQAVSDSAMRDRVGGAEAFYITQCDVMRDGFAQAIDIAIANRSIAEDQRSRLMARYHVRMGETMRRVNQHALAEKEIERAKNISPDHTSEWVKRRQYSWALPLLGDTGLTIA